MKVNLNAKSIFSLIIHIVILGLGAYAKEKSGNALVKNMSPGERVTPADDAVTPQV